MCCGDGQRAVCVVVTVRGLCVYRCDNRESRRTARCGWWKSRPSMRWTAALMTTDVNCWRPWERRSPNPTRLEDTPGRGVGGGGGGADACS